MVVYIDVCLYLHLQLCMHALSLSHTELFETLCTVASQPGSSAYGIFQATVLEWVAISFLGDLPDPGIEPWSPKLQADSFMI